MDRHDVSEGVSAEVLAEIHQEDLKIEHEYGCRGFTYWFDQKRKNVFCLIEAPNKEAITRMHKHAHGDVPNTIIEVEPTIVESFLGRISDPEKDQSKELNIINDSAYRILMAINSNRIIYKQNSTVSKSISKNFDTEIVKLIEKHHGNIVKRNTSFYLISFKSAVNAIKTALKIESDLKPKYSTPSTHIKIAIASGEPVTNKPQIFEDTISLISRMCEIVDADITISYEVKTLFKSEQRSLISDNSQIRVLSPSEETFLIQLMDEVEISWQNSEFNIDNFSENLGYSKSQLYRKLTTLTGKSPNAFIRDYRLTQALNLLNLEKGNISEIAFETGFNSLAYFSKCFKNKFKILPSDYISKHKHTN